MAYIRGRSGTILLAGGFAAWLVVILLLPPRIPGGDFICFKDPGVNLAFGEGLVERLSPANHTVEPRFYSNYPPLFPVLYGAYVYVVGLGPKTDEIFDLLLIASATVLFWASISEPVGAKTPLRFSVWTLALTILLLPIGPFWTQRERPDYLAFIAAALSFLIVSSRKRARRVLLAGFVAGLNIFISPYGFVLSCLGLVCLAIFAEDAVRLRSSLRVLLLSAAGMLPPVLCLLLVYLQSDPSALMRLVASGSGQSTQGHAGLGYFVTLLTGDVHGFMAAFSRFDSFRYKWMLCHLLFVSAIVTACVLWSPTYKLVPGWFWRLGSLLIITAVPILIFPYQPCYMSLTAAVIVLLFVRIFPSRDFGPPVAVISLACIAIIALPFTCREFVLAYVAHPSFRALQRRADELAGSAERPLLTAISAPTYFAFKRQGFVVADISYIVDPRPFDLFVFNFNNALVGGEHKYPHWWHANDFQCIYSPPKEERPRLMHFTVGSRVASWLGEIWRWRRPNDSGAVDQSCASSSR